MATGLIENLKSRLLKDEGLRLKPYHDTKGKLTIGIGRNLDDVGISKSEALMLLENDINEVLVSLSKFKWFTLLNENRKLVILDMAFNMGMPTFLNFKDTIKAIEQGDFNLASIEMLNSHWAQDVGKRAIELAALMKG